MVRGDLTSLIRKVIVALITTDVHNRDIIEKLAQSEVENKKDFIW
jgi:dynein heavy chain